MFTLPPDAPDTTPPDVTVATAVLLLVHTPPPAASEKVVVAPTQIADEPLVIVPATGSGLTVIAAVAASVPQLLVTL